MNFEVVGNKTFKADVSIYSRNYYATYKRNKKIKIKNLITGETLFDNLNENEILINNQAFSNINDLQDILFNKNCLCDNHNENGKLKIFDGTFDNTFE
ncbi:MAG: hypothetical protein ACRC8Z_03225 [Empedobacter falsenii]